VVTKAEVKWMDKSQLANESQRAEPQLASSLSNNSHRRPRLGNIIVALLTIAIVSLLLLSVF